MNRQTHKAHTRSEEERPTVLFFVGKRARKMRDTKQSVRLMYAKITIPLEAYRIELYLCRLN